MTVRALQPKTRSRSSQRTQLRRLEEPLKSSWTAETGASRAICLQHFFQVCKNPREQARTASNVPACSSAWHAALTGAKHHPTNGQRPQQLIDRVAAYDGQAMQEGLVKRSAACSRRSVCRRGRGVAGRGREGCASAARRRGEAPSARGRARRLPRHRLAPAAGVRGHAAAARGAGRRQRQGAPRRLGADGQHRTRDPRALRGVSAHVRFFFTLRRTHARLCKPPVVCGAPASLRTANALRRTHACARSPRVQVRGGGQPAAAVRVPRAHQRHGGGEQAVAGGGLCAAVAARDRAGHLDGGRADADARHLQRRRCARRRALLPQVPRQRPQRHLRAHDRAAGRGAPARHPVRARPRPPHMHAQRASRAPPHTPHRRAARSMHGAHACS